MRDPAGLPVDLDEVADATAAGRAALLAQAGKRSEHIRSVDLERRGDLLVRRVAGDGDRPPPTDFAAVRDCDLVNLPVGRRRVDIGQSRIDHRARGGDLKRTLPRSDPGRYELPENRSGGRVERDRPAVGRVDDVHILNGAGNENAVEVDRRRVDRAGQRDDQRNERREVLGGDPGHRRPGVASRRVVPEGRPGRRGHLPPPGLRLRSDSRPDDERGSSDEQSSKPPGRGRGLGRRVVSPSGDGRLYRSQSSRTCRQMYGAHVRPT